MALFALVGCQALGSAQGLVVELQAQGLPAQVGQEFNGELLGGDGSTICAGDESIQLYEFPDHAAAQAAAAKINRDDPSMIGNAIVEWIGPPRFWLRDRVIVQYVGSDANVDAALRQLLGPPLAEAVGWGGGMLPAHRRGCQPAGV